MSCHSCLILMRIVILDQLLLDLTNDDDLWCIEFVIKTFDVFRRNKFRRKKSIIINLQNSWRITIWNKIRQEILVMSFDVIRWQKIEKNHSSSFNIRQMTKFDIFFHQIVVVLHHSTSFDCKYAWRYQYHMSFMSLWVLTS